MMSSGAGGGVSSTRVSCDVRVQSGDASVGEARCVPVSGSSVSFVSGGSSEGSSGSSESSNGFVLLGSGASGLLDAGDGTVAGGSSLVRGGSLVLSSGLDGIVGLSSGARTADGARSDSTIGDVGVDKTDRSLSSSSGAASSLALSGGVTSIASVAAVGSDPRLIGNASGSCDSQFEDVTSASRR
jgi:hypothetical protein